MDDLVIVPEISEHNPRALFGKSLRYSTDFLNSAPGVVFRNLQYNGCPILIGSAHQPIS